MQGAVARLGRSDVSDAHLIAAINDRREPEEPCRISAARPSSGYVWASCSAWVWCRMSRSILFFSLLAPGCSASQRDGSKIARLGINRRSPGVGLPHDIILGQVMYLGVKWSSTGLCSGIIQPTRTSPRRRYRAFRSDLEIDGR
jgi:hypothetical protein